DPSARHERRALRSVAWDVPILGKGTALADEVRDHACSTEHKPELNVFPCGQPDSGKPAGNDLECKADTHKYEHGFHQKLHRSFEELCNIHVISLEGRRAVPFNTGDDWTRLHLTAKTGKN